ncbi:extensin-2-like isoform X2 [Haliotis rufescens]|uniref:extensin-2-like isoform X2 n=1 Tax=Haliotis rufescens TaxID=6454 RepID=UPI00201F6C20|nr:extensin-2-like isoform X2 [Haliotis rufescens]XP_046363956.2 extensin-2-like isoform X2 [Haliotis rufescens]
MTTPERSNPKRNPSTDAAGASRSCRGCMENADFLKRGDRNSPGPCYATPPPSMLSPGPQFSFSSRHMPSPFAIAMGNPGPGAHIPMAPSERDRGPSFSFGSRQRDLYFSNSPGPCYATPPPSWLSPGPKFSITSRHMPSRFAIAIEED